jgi:hypothetical protein
MQKMLRRIIIPEDEQYLIEIPNEYINRRIEILILPFDEEYTVEPQRMPLKLTTFQCDGKLRDFTREDAYRERV